MKAWNRAQQAVGSAIIAVLDIDGPANDGLSINKLEGKYAKYIL